MAICGGNLYRRVGIDNNNKKRIQSSNENKNISIPFSNCLLLNKVVVHMYIDISLTINIHVYWIHLTVYTIPYIEL